MSVGAWARVCASVRVCFLVVGLSFHMAMSDAATTSFALACPMGCYVSFSFLCRDVGPFDLSKELRAPEQSSCIACASSRAHSRLLFVTWPQGIQQVLSRFAPAIRANGGPSLTLSGGLLPETPEGIPREGRSALDVRSLQLNSTQLNSVVRV